MAFREPPLFEVPLEAKRGGTSSQATTKNQKLQIKEFICSLDFFVSFFIKEERKAIKGFIYIFNSKF
jgi:hypothetical protein